jgi:Tfp pilus assembly protein PilF
METPGHLEFDDAEVLPSVRSSSRHAIDRWSSKFAGDGTCLSIKFGVYATLLLGLATFSPCSARAQEVIEAHSPSHLQVHPGESKTMRLKGGPHSIEVLEVDLEGSLVNIQTQETKRRLLDLGRGGRLFLAVEIPESGVAEIEITSGERLRTASLTLAVVTSRFSPEQQRHLLAAGIAFAKADSTRRHQPQAPEPAVALAEYEVAATEALAAGDPSLAGWALTQKGRFLLYNKSSYVESRDLLKRTAALLPPDDAALAGLLYKTLSSCEYYLGDLPQSVADGEHALELYRKTGDVYWQGIVLGNLLAGYTETGREDKAAEAGREALSDAEQTADTAGVVFSLTELANLYRRQGSLQLAFESFREAEAWAEDIRYAPLVQAQIEQAFGQFYEELGQLDEAEAQLSACLKHAAPNSASALEALGSLARIIGERGDLAASLAEYDRAIVTARDSKLPREEAGLLLSRSATLLKAKRAEAARQDAQSATLLAETAGAPSLSIDAALAEGAACLEACARPGDAGAIYTRALGWIEETGEREQGAVAEAGVAQVDAAEGRYYASLEDSERALAIVEHSRASLRSHDLAADYFAERRGWYALAAEAALRLDALHPGAGYRDRAFQFSERARARAMLDAVGEPAVSTELSKPTDPPGGVSIKSVSGTSSHLELLERRIVANQYQIEATKDRLLSGSDPKLAAAALKSLYREQDALQTEHASRIAGSGSASLYQIASLARIQADLLDSNSALLAYSAGQGETLRWLITRTEVKVDRLPAMEELSRSTEPLHHMLRVRSEPKPGEDAAGYAARLKKASDRRELSLAKAGALLLPSISPSIQRLYLVADGPLQTLPWNALRTHCHGRPCYAIERYAIAIEPSASIALALAHHAAHKPGGRVVVVSDRLAGNKTGAPSWQRLEALPGSQREAAAIGRLLPAGSFSNLRRGDATTRKISDTLGPDVSVLHLATHTLLVAGHPELSGITLSPFSAKHHSLEEKASQNVLWLKDIPHLAAPPLVVLSGCTTQGDDLAGEELTTLTQAFFYAGAQEVIASSWPVDDDATVALMDQFYRGLLVRHRSAADALRTAQLHSLAQGADLGDWAAFLIDGVPANTAAPPGPGYSLAAK